MDRKYLQNNHWTYYEMLESKFINILDYIELSEGNYPTYSRELTLLIQAIGAELDVVFKVYLDVLGCEFENKRVNMGDYAKEILKDYPNIVGQVVRVRNKDINLTPFNDWDAKKAAQSLYWWTAYTNIKHNRVTSFQEANLENTLNTLAALYLLEMKLFLKLSVDTELDIPDRESKLFTLAAWPNKNLSFSSINLKIL